MVIQSWLGAGDGKRDSLVDTVKQGLFFLREGKTIYFLLRCLSMD